MTSPRGGATGGAAGSAPAPARLTSASCASLRNSHTISGARKLGVPERRLRPLSSSSSGSGVPASSCRISASSSSSKTEAILPIIQKVRAFPSLARSPTHRSYAMDRWRA